MTHQKLSYESKQSVKVVPLLIAFGMTTTAAFGSFNIPTDAPSSPLFNATPFSQKLLMFEEFGTQAFPIVEQTDAPLLPPALGCSSGPAGDQLDAFLSTPSLFPLPGVESDSTKHTNAWLKMANTCLNAGLTNPPLDARPPGPLWAHQRWDEFKPTVFFQSALTGARVSGGMRDKFQMHGYKKGEFGPGGLYYNAVSSITDKKINTAFNGTTRGIGIRIHPLMPVQDANSVWTFDGTLPPKLLMARYGKTILFRNHNALPIDIGANNGFGTHTISTHEHNGHNPAESDGFAHAYLYPGQFYDYRWPMILAGYDSVNTDASNPRAGTPDGQGGIENLRGDPGEVMSTHWFHDHMLDYTAQNVYKGNAAMMNYYSSVDRGREPASANEAKNGSVGYRCHYADPVNNTNLCLPSGANMDWGNRDYDMNLVVADKAWDSKGQLFFNIFNTDGFLGDRMTVNWQYKPFVDVRARRYRFRILNGSVARYFKIAIVDDKNQVVPFHIIGNDGNLMEHAVAFPNSQSAAIPTQSIAERFDIIVDFKTYKAGRKLYLVNLMEHADGKGPKQEIPLADVLSGKYKADGLSGDPAVGKFLEFRVQSYSGTDLSMNPADYVEGKNKLVPRPIFTPDELANAKHRTFDFVRGGGTSTTDASPWSIKTDNGDALTADPHRVSAAPDIGSVEIWHLKNNSGGWSHPVHVHFEEAQILYRGGIAPPIWEKWARKDVFRVGPEKDSTGSVDIAIRVREFAGTYVEHCHNTQHEDHAMLLRWDSQQPGTLVAVPTPMMDWRGVWAENSVTLPTWKTGDLDAKANFKLP